MKTKFIFNLKQFLFLLVAFLGTFVSYSQQQNPSIGGSKTPIPDPINIGGGGKGSSDPVLQKFPIVREKTDCIFAYLNDMGGFDRRTRTGEYISYEIGGKGTPGDLNPGGLVLNPCDYSDHDTGGLSGVIGIGQFVMNSIEYTLGHICNPNSRGRDSCIIRNYEDDYAGVINSSGSIGEYYELYSWCNLPQ